jgi:hypothetical protein
MANTVWSGTDKFNCTISGGNLVATATGASAWVRAVDKQVAGKFYWEVTTTSNTLASTAVGIASSVAVLTNGFGATAQPGTCGVIHGGTVYVDAISQGTNLLGTIASGTVVCFAFDADTRLIWIRSGAAGNWNGSASANPATGAGGIQTTLGRGIPAYPAFFAGTSPDAATANFGDAAFVGAVPSGYTSGFTTTPTMAGFTTWDAATATSVTLSSGNLAATVTGTTSADQGAHVPVSDGKTTGKYYFETEFTYLNTAISTGVNIGFGVGTTASTYTSMGNGGGVVGVEYYKSQSVYANGSMVAASSTQVPTLQKLGIAVDLDNRRIWFKKLPSGNWNENASYDPATNTGGYTVPAGTMIPFVTFGGSGGGPGSIMTANFGASAFTGAVPSGFTSGWPGLVSAIPTNAIASQALAEHWLTTDPDARITQVVAEHWASTTSTGLQAVVTFVALEHWTSVAVVVPAAGGPMVTMIH